ncbi:MAG: type II toxin-antitoxin system prevent-host-death family antitoxin [Tepidisphaeraceae bacterium]|jgi:prevent-host-death family protein
MVRVATNEAQAHLAELVLRASRGETILITERGQPMAKLIPAGATPQLSMSQEQTILALRDIRSRTTLAPGQTLKELIREGRKY